MKIWILIMFLTLGMGGMYSTQNAIVTDVREGTVILQTKEGVYAIPEDEAWRIGDPAECLIHRGKIIIARYKWR